MEAVETLIIGGGQAGLTMSQALSKHGRPHLVLERGRVAERWLSERWNGLHFQTPNALVRLPDFPFVADNPNGFATGAEIAAYLAAYAAFIDAPVRSGVSVTALRAGFVAETSAGDFRAKNVVVATGPFQRPAIPQLLPDTLGITQMHARDYRSPGALPEGSVLVIGAGASGSQIAEELMRLGVRCISPSGNTSVLRAGIAVMTISGGGSKWEWTGRRPTSGLWIGPPSCTPGRTVGTRWIFATLPGREWCCWGGR